MSFWERARRRCSQDERGHLSASHAKASNRLLRTEVTNAAVIVYRARYACRAMDTLSTDVLTQKSKRRKRQTKRFRN